MDLIANSEAKDGAATTSRDNSALVSQNRFDTLSDELVSRIFTIAAEYNPEEYKKVIHEDSKVPSQFVVVASQVCHQWFNLIRANINQHLWLYGAYVSFSGDKPEESLKNFIQRLASSGRSDLYVTPSFDFDHDLGTPDKIRFTLEALTALRRHRSQIAFLEISDISASLIALAAEFQSCPRLRRFEIRNIQHLESEDLVATERLLLGHQDSQPFSDPHTIHTLDMLTIQGQFHGVSISKIFPSLPRLTIFELQMNIGPGVECEWDDLSSFISANRQLTQMSLNILQFSSSPEAGGLDPAKNAVPLQVQEAKLRLPPHIFRNLFRAFSFRRLRILEIRIDSSHIKEYQTPEETPSDPDPVEVPMLKDLSYPYRSQAGDLIVSSLTGYNLDVLHIDEPDSEEEGVRVSLPLSSSPRTLRREICTISGDETPDELISKLTIIDLRKTENIELDISYYASQASPGIVAAIVGNAIRGHYAIAPSLRRLEITPHNQDSSLLLVLFYVHALKVPTLELAELHLCGPLTLTLQFPRPTGPDEGNSPSVSASYPLWEHESEISSKVQHIGDTGIPLAVRITIDYDEDYPPEVLRQLIPIPISQGGHFICLPYLGSLVVDFKAKGAKDGESEIEIDEIVDSLEKVAEWRMRCGFPIGKVVLTERDGTERQLYPFTPEKAAEMRSKELEWSNLLILDP